MRKHKGDALIIVLMLILMGLGLLVMYTIGPVRANFLNAASGKEEYSESFFFLHQLISVGLSVGAFVVFAKFLNYEKVQKLSRVLMIVALSACAVLALAQVTNMPLAKCELGACRWIQVGRISIQPAEFVKFAVVLYLASIFTKYRGKGKNILLNKDFLWRFLVSVGASLFFIVIMQKDLGSGVPIAVIALFMLFESGIPLKSFLIVCTAVVVLGVGAIMSSPHRRERLWTYLGGGAPEQSEEDDADAYHIENALIAIGTGGLFGVGIGNSVQATGYLPESINDSVFAIMGETLGFLKLVLVLLAFAWLLFRILRVSDYSSDYQNSLIAIGVFAWIMTHLVVNVMAMTNIIPLTGITLPLLSYGGTSMMAVGAALGYVYQLSMYTSREVTTDEKRKREFMEDTGFNRNISYEQVNYRRRR
ncbi:FtsW/RodA/SpoVE family cell cycle protein [Candidatus Saccharibacteria bacterium]|nr:FtsW/RodA/SpoVE family cell cycle protein [Candidatus Saccharibacteria bacterium]